MFILLAYWAWRYPFGRNRQSTAVIALEHFLGPAEGLLIPPSCRPATITALNVLKSYKLVAFSGKTHACTNQD